MKKGLIMKNCIITACNNVYEENLLLDFLPTLRNDAEFTGLIALVDYGCNNLESLKKYVDYVLPRPITNDNFCFHLNQRSGEIVEIIDIFHDVDCFMYADAGDVWFQRPLDELWNLVKDGVGAVAENITCSDPWFMAIISKLSEAEKNKVHEATKDRVMFNAGVFAGERNQLRILCDTWFKNAKESASPHFGLCQVYFNYSLAINAKLNFVNLPRSYNYIAQAFPFRTEGNVMFDSTTNEKVHIGHNAGVFRPVPRIYNGVNINKVSKENKL